MSKYTDYSDDYDDDYDDYDGGRTWRTPATVKGGKGAAISASKTTGKDMNVEVVKKTSDITPKPVSTPTPATSVMSAASKIQTGTPSVSTPSTQQSTLKATPSQQHVAKFISDSERTETMIKDAISTIKTSNSVNILVVGHVDAGKSTIFGHFAVLANSVSTRDRTKAQALADTYNKSTFSYAFLLDTDDDERRRGVTIDVCNHVLELSLPVLGKDYEKPKRILLQDCPGHKDFVPSLIRAAAQPDAAVLVIDSSFQEFEKGISEDGQTREHLQLLMIFGIKHLIVAINKLDRVDWNEGRFVEISTVLKKLLYKEIQFTGTATFIPVSGISEDGCHNLTPGDAGRLKLPDWAKKHKSLGEELYSVQSIRSSSQVKGEKVSPTIILYDIAPDTYEGKKVFSTTCIIESGILASSDSIVHLPSMFLFSIAAILNGSVQTDRALAYDTVTLQLIPDKRATRLCNNCDKADVGAVLKEMPQGSCFVLAGIILQQGPISRGSSINNMVFSSMAKAVVLVLDTPQGISAGDIYDSYIGSNRVEARVHKITAQIDPASQAVIRKNPPIAAKGAYIKMVLVFNNPIMLKQFAASKLMGRIILRNNNATVGLGKIEAISDSK